MKSLLTEWRNFILKENWIRIKEEPETRDSDLSPTTCAYKGQKGTCMKFLQKKNGKKIVVTMFEPDPKQASVAKQESYFKPENIKKVLEMLNDSKSIFAYEQESGSESLEPEQYLKELKAKCPRDPRTAYNYAQINNTILIAINQEYNKYKKQFPNQEYPDWVEQNINVLEQNLIKKYVGAPQEIQNINYFRNNDDLCLTLIGLK